MDDERIDDELLDDGLALERGKRGLAKTIDDYPEEKREVYRRLLNDGLARAARVREESEHASAKDSARSHEDGARG